MEEININLTKFLKDFQDYLAPNFDVYEQTIYLYIFRHTRLIGIEEKAIGFKSHRLKLASGVGKAGSPISEGVCYKRLHSLQEKGAIKIIGTERNGIRVKLFLPDEMNKIVPSLSIKQPLSMEEMDFFTHIKERISLLERENNQCFYCFGQIDSSNYVVEHVVSRPTGNNSYKNLVASCLRCNNRKGSNLAEDYLRILYREGLLNSKEFEERIIALKKLKSGELKPNI